VLGEDHDADPRPQLAERVGRADALLGERRRHPDLDDRDVGRALADRLEQIIHGGRLADDIESRAPQQRGNPLAYHQDVIGEDNAHGPSAASLTACRRTVNRFDEPANPAAQVVSRQQRHGGERFDSAAIPWCGASSIISVPLARGVPV
jgi:hypothetical protein